MPRVLALATACLFVLLPAAAHAAVTIGDVTQTPLTIEHIMTGPDNQTECSIKADLYTPKGVSHSNPAPAVLATNGFGGSKSDFGDDKGNGLAWSYAKRGFVFLAYSGLGFGDSSCKIELDDPDWDGKAGRDLVTFLGGGRTATSDDDTSKQVSVDYVIHDARDHDGVAQAHDPRVGMIGGSYGGQIQFSIAGVDPRMDALVPQITWNDLSYSLTPNNTDFAKGVTYNTPGVVKIDWPVLFFGLGVGQGFQQAIANQDPSHVNGQCPNFDDRVCQSLVQSSVRGYDDDATLELLRHASVSTYMKNIKIPTFLAQGQSDTLFDLQEAIATYQALRAQNTPVKMLWRSAGHSGGDISGENDENNPEAAYESRLELEFLDYYLRGLGDPPKLDFLFLRDWGLPKSGDAAPAVGETPSFPATTTDTLYLSGGDSLVPALTGVQSGSADIAAVPMAPTATGGGFADTGANDAPGTSATFTTAPLPAATDVAGPPKLTVRISAPTFSGTQSVDALGHLLLFAKLYDVAPDGTPTLPRNLVSAVRVADVDKPVTIELPGIVHRFPKGDQMQLVLSTSDVAYRGNTFGGPVSILTDRQAPGVLTVPVLGKQLGQTGSGPSGTTPFTPSPEAPKPQPAGLGALPTPAAARPAARLPSSRRCASRRSFRIRSAVVTVNGKRVRVLGGKRLRAPVNLRGLPKGAVRVTVTVHTARGRTFRSARTYHTCTAKRRH